MANHRMDIKIYYEDTDCGGVVYYANYLRYMERARTEYMADRGAPVKELMDLGIIFVIARVEIDYRMSGRYGDTIVIETWVSECTAASITFRHVMKQKESGKVLTEAMAKAVCVDPSIKPKRIPKDIAEKLTA
ncbi:MAG TPA: acyl-CoA thioesterase [Nitrospiraceae bacterium]|jgi:acyl-CoA thioester hydrolase|nr:acyl-CoA thioesterase [Nitrospiraceae bacterium]